MLGLSLTQIALACRQAVLRPLVSGKRLLEPTGAVTTWRGTNQGNWGENYEPDAAIIKSLGAKVVRILIRWKGDYSAGTDSYDPNPENDYLNPANYAKFKQELDWLEAQGLWIIVAFDSNYGAGNGRLGTADWNFFDTTDTAGKELYKAQFKQAWKRIVRDCRGRQRVLCYEPLPEPMPDNSTASHAPLLRDFYREVIAAIREEDAVTPFLIGPRASYNALLLDEVYLPERTDCLYTVDLLSGKVEDEANIAAFIEVIASFRDANNVPVLVQQVGRNTSDDEGQGTAQENIGLTAFNGVLSCLNAHDIPFTHWQFHQNSTNTGAYSLYVKINAGVNSADNWAPKQNEIDSFAYHMLQNGAAIEAAAVAAATACGGELLYVKGDLANAYQVSSGGAGNRVTAVSQPLGLVDPVVGTVNVNQATALNRPTLVKTVNGYAMQFDGVNSWMNFSSTYFTSGSDCTVIVACRPAAGNTNRVILHIGNSAATARYPYVGIVGSDEAQVVWRGDDNVATGGASITKCDDRAIVITGVKEGNNKWVGLNGVRESAIETAVAGSVASFTRARLGGTTTASNLFTGQIALVFLCKNAVTDEQKRAIARWGAWLMGAPFRGAIPA
ncbi:MAG: cellulase family glycosylhydrolase [Burkholderiales bacterium]|nr:cellulase family glycosylhydrolase [Burkholderiales bacterium]